MECLILPPRQSFEEHIKQQILEGALEPTLSVIKTLYDDTVPVNLARARSILDGLVAQGILRRDKSGRYRLAITDANDESQTSR